MATPQQETFTNVQPIQAAETFTDIRPIGKKDYWGSSADEVGDFLAKNPSYQYLDKDPRFPNRRPGIYPAGPGSEWRKNPDSPNHDIDQFPIDLHSGKHTYEGIKTGLIGATAPLAIEATWPQIIAGLVGGGAGSAAGEQIAKKAGGGEMTQEVAGDVGGLLGGAVSTGVANIATSKARAIYEALPEELQTLLRKKAVGVASPRLKNAIDFWDTLGQIKDHFFGSAKPSAELDATGENVPFAGEKAPKPAPVLDATGENKPFAGGMDEWSPARPQKRFTLASLDPDTMARQQAGGLARLPIAQPAPVPALPPTPAAPAPGAAGSLAESIKAGGTKGASLLTRLRAIASDIDAHEKASATAAIAAGKVTPDPEQDLTDLLLESLKNVRAKKAATVQ